MSDYLNAVGTEHVMCLADRIAQLLRAELPGLTYDFTERAIAASALASAAQRLDGLAESGERCFEPGGVTAGLMTIGAHWKDRHQR